MTKLHCAMGGARRGRPRRDRGGRRGRWRRRGTAGRLGIVTVPTTVFDAVEIADTRFGAPATKTRCADAATPAAIPNGVSIVMLATTVFDVPLITETLPMPKPPA